jgi:hypothetical protein
VSKAGYCVAEVLNDVSLWGKRCRSETVSSSVRPRVTIARTDVRACHERNQCAFGTLLCCEYAHKCCAVAKPQWLGDSALTGGPQTGVEHHRVGRRVRLSWAQSVRYQRLTGPLIS